MPYLLKIAGFSFQIISLLIVVELLQPKDLASYFLVIAVSSIAATFSDFGFVRFSYRYLHRGVDGSLVIARAFMLLTLGTLITLPLTIIFIQWRGEDWPIAVVAYMANVLAQLNNISRYCLIFKRKYISTIWIEAAQPLIYAAILAGFFWLMPDLIFSLPFAFLVLLVSQILSFVFSVYLARNAQIWVSGLRQAAKTKCSWKTWGGIWRSIKRALPVGLDLLSSVTWLSLPTVLAEMQAGSTVIAQLGFLQRFLNVARGLVGVSIVIKLNDYYSSRSPFSYSVRTLVAAFSAFLLSFLVLTILNMVLPLLELEGQAASIILVLLDHPLPIALCFALLIGYLQISFISLGANIKTGRLLGTVTGLITLTIVTTKVIWVVPDYGVAGYIWALVLSFISAITVTIIFICRKGYL